MAAIIVRMIPNALDGRGAGTSVRYHDTVRPRCSVGKKPFSAAVRVAYRPTGDRMPEFASLRRAIRELARGDTTVEGLASGVFDLVAALPVCNLSVEVRAETSVHGPVTVVVE